MNETISTIIKDLSEAALAIVTLTCMIINTKRKKKSKKSKKK